MSTWLPTVSWWWVVPAGCCWSRRRAGCWSTAAGARLLLRGIGAGRVPARRQDPPAALARRAAGRRAGCRQPRRCRSWMRVYARRSARRSGKHVDLHSIPPVTGMLTLGDGCSIEPEVDLTGHWLDGDVLHVGSGHGRGARPGRRHAARCARARPSAQEPRWRPGRRCSGWSHRASTGRARRRSEVGLARGPWADTRPPNRAAWVLGYAGSRRAHLPAAGHRRGRDSRDLLRPRCGRARRSATRRALRSPACRPLSCSLLVVLAVLILLLVRLLSVGLVGGHHPIHGRRAWQAWSTLRVLDEARTWLFPLYSSTLTPAWLRALGARVGSERRGLDRAADPQADHGQRRGVPRRRHPARRLRARRRLAARRAGEGRQARVRRQLRDGGARPQGAQAGAGRRAVGGPAPDQGQGGHVVARQPADPAAPAGRRRRRQPDLRPARAAARSPAALVELLPAGAGRCSTVAHRARRGASLLEAARRPVGWWLPRRCCPGSS